MANIMAEMKKDQKTKGDKAKDNAKVLFDALQDTRVVSIVVDFNGCGDSGQIDSIQYYDHRDKDLSQPEGKIKGSKLHKGSTWDEKLKTFVELPNCEGSFNEVVEEICYDRLGARHAGWEINEGSYGTFNFNVLNRKINLEFNERVETIRSSEECF